MGASLYEIIDDYLKSFFDAAFIAPHDSPQYQRDSEAIHDILTRINDGKPVTEEKLREMAEHYLVSKVSLSITELELLKERLAGKAWLTRLEPHAFNEAYTVPYAPVFCFNNCLR
jgi:hypothetical protein